MTFSSISGIWQIRPLIFRWKICKVKSTAGWLFFTFFKNFSMSYSRKTMYCVTNFRQSCKFLKVYKKPTSTSWRVFEYLFPWSSVHPHPGAANQGSARKSLLTVNPALATSEVSSKLRKTHRPEDAQVRSIVKSHHGNVVSKSIVDKVRVDDDRWYRNQFPVETTYIILVCFKRLGFERADY